MMMDWLTFEECFLCVGRKGALEAQHLDRKFLRPPVNHRCTPLCYSYPLTDALVRRLSILGLLADLGDYPHRH